MEGRREGRDEWRERGGREGERKKGEERRKGGRKEEGGREKEEIVDDGQVPCSETEY